MTLTLHVDGPRWREHLLAVAERTPGLVPVAKGNGYGFGLGVLARESLRLRAGALAVGTAHEVSTVRLAGWTRDVVILNPWRPADEVATSLLDDPKVITTVSRVQDLDLLRTHHRSARVLCELDTTMHRHGMVLEDLDRVSVGDLTFEGWSIHLPATGSLDEATTLARAALARRTGAVWVSHLSASDYVSLRDSLGVRAHMRVGTRLWLGSPTALTTTATVLDVHPIARGGTLGYHQARAPRDGFIVVVSGGTAHGVALAAPVPQRSLRQRLVTVADGLMRATGATLSPYMVSGRKLPFAEPPHMHSSMLFLAGREATVEVGDEVPVTCRMTTTTFDDIVWT